MLEAEGTSRRLISTRHGHVHVRSNGEGDPPLVLLHMGLSSGRMYRHITPRLSAGRRVVVPDRLGFGCSDHPRPGLSLGDYADSTIDALDAMGIGQFDVAGVHTGSCEAIDLAVRYPDRVRRIAVVTVPVFSPEEIPQYKDNYLHEPKPDADGSHLDWYWRWWRDGGFGGAAERSRAWSPELLHEFLMDHLGAQPDPWMTYHAVFDHPTGEFVSKIRQPFLVVDVHDDLTTQTARAMPLLPAHTQVVSRPDLTDVLELFTTAADEIGDYFEEFFGEALP